MSNRKGLDPAIVGSLIGVAGTIIVAAITIYASRPQSQPAQQPPTQAAINPTIVSPETNTPASTAPTEGPVMAPANPSVPSPVVGQDWMLNCISESWVLYPSGIQPVINNGCLTQPVDKFYTTNGRLAFVYDGRVGSAEVHGLFTKLPASGSVRLNIFLGEVTGGEVIAGIFAQPNFESTGVFVVAPSGNNVRKQKIEVKTMPGQSLFAQTVEPIEADPPIYDFLLAFDSGNVSVRTRNDQIDFGTASVVSPEKWLFLGYQVLNGTNQMQAEFYNLSISESR